MSDITDISELRAKAARNDSSKWTAADAMKDFQREIDAQEVIPEHMIIVFTEIIDGEQRMGYRNVTPGGLMALGMLERAKWHIQNN